MRERLWVAIGATLVLMAMQAEGRWRQSPDPEPPFAGVAHRSWYDFLVR